MVATSEFSIKIWTRNHEMKKLYDEGLSISFIAEQYGLSIRRTKRIIRKVRKLVAA